jgi:ribosomal protein S18 acetylase RimI-like enzyme
MESIQAGDKNIRRKAMMNIDIIKSKNKHLGGCAAALLRSDLGTIYFSDENRAYKTLSDGISKGEISVAVNGRSECLGFIWIIPKGAFKFPFLHMIAVKEEYRNLGIGKTLLKYFEDVVKENASKAFLLVGDFNPKAKKLYERVGYKEVGRIPGLYKEGVTESLMMKKLH